jgi:large subunit ribosomal protein L4
MIKKIDTLPDWLKELGESLSPTVLWQANRVYHNNLRQFSASTKTRGMVKATGKKPYRQKKTGRARRGSMVAPLHRGGGVAHGPLPVKKRLRLNQKVGQSALLLSVYEKFKSEQLFLLDTSPLKGKTKEAFSLFKEAGFKKETICCSLLKEEETAYRSLRNLQFLRPVQGEVFVSWDVTRRDTLVFSKESWDLFLERRLEKIRREQ